MKNSQTQFLRIEGFPRGRKSKAGTMEAVIAEGIREPTHTGHLERQPAILILDEGAPIPKPSMLPEWIRESMDQCRYGQSDRYPNGRPLRKNAVALGAFVASLPTRTVDTPEEVISNFAADTSAWMREYLEDRQMMLHYTVVHLDEEHPHVHGWFTPNTDLIEKGDWPLGQVVYPQRQAIKDMQLDFFETVGQHFYHRQAKPKVQQRKRLDRKTAIRLRDMPETLTRHPVFDLGFMQAALALMRLAEEKGVTEQRLAYDLVQEMLSIEAGLSNRDLINQILDEQKMIAQEKVAPLDSTRTKTGIPKSVALDIPVMGIVNPKGR